jgi:hypothetical protein
MRSLPLLTLCACPTENAISPHQTGTSSPEMEEEEPERADPSLTVHPTPELEEEPEEVEEPDPYIYEEEELAPLWSLEEVQAALEEGLETWQSMDPELVFDAQTEARGQGDTACPYYYDSYYESYGYYYLYGGCSTGAEDTWTGYQYGVDYGSYTSGDYTYQRYGWWYGDIRQDRSDGSRFEMSGYFYMYDYTYTPYNRNYFYVNFTGAAEVDSEEHAGDWLGQGLSLDLIVSGYHQPEMGGLLSMEGGLSGLSGAANSLRFNGLFWAAEGWGVDCQEEPGGSVSLRDAEGGWYDVYFDGPAYENDTVFGPECDGCGEVWYQGELLGEICPAFDTLTEWEGRPW